MSSSAGVTVPAKRQVYKTNFQVSSKDKTPRNKTKKVRVKSGSSKSKDESEELHKSWGKSKNYAYVFTGTGDEKPWSKLENAPPTKPRTYKNKPKPATAANEDHHIYKIKEDGKRKVRKGTLVVSDKYFEAVKDERTRLLDLLDSLEKRNKVLERENADMVSNFETLHRENEQLRKKLDTGGEPVIESYKRVYSDRMLLREAENTYKKRLFKLEEELRIMQRKYDKVNDELRVLREKTHSTKKSEDIRINAKYNRHYWDSYHLRAENEYLKESIKAMRHKIEAMSSIQQKSPKTAPAEMRKLPEKVVQESPTVKPTEVFGHHVKYLTLPEIEERQHTGGKRGIPGV